MRTEQKNKLEGQVDKVRWMGINNKLENAYCVYWLMKRIVTVEHNVYWRPLEHGIEGEEEVMHPSDATLTYVNDPQLHATATATATAKSGLSVPQPQATISTNATVTLPAPDPITTPHPKRICQPSQRVLDIINSKALDPAPLCSVQLPDPIAKDPKPDSRPTVFEGEGTADQTLAVVNYDNDIKLILELNKTIAEAEALEPTPLAEAKRRLDWPQWEQGIREELAMLNKARTWCSLIHPWVPTLSDPSGYSMQKRMLQEMLSNTRRALLHKGFHRYLASITSTRMPRSQNLHPSTQFSL